MILCNNKDKEEKEMYKNNCFVCLKNIQLSPPIEGKDIKNSDILNILNTINNSE